MKSKVVSNKLWIKSCAMASLVISVLLIYLSPYWSFENSSRSTSLIRIGLLLTSLFLAVFFLAKDKCFRSCRLRFSPVSKTLTVLFLYLAFNSLFLSEDLKPIRRLLLLFFLFLPFLFVQINAQVVRKLIILVAVVISAFSVLSIVNQYFQGGLPTGYRKGLLVSSGIDGVASFGNTIVAAMHYAIGFTVLLYLFFTESKRYLLWLWVILASFVALYIALTFARSAWVACLVSALVIYTLTFNKSQLRFLLIPILLFCVLLYFVTNFIGYEVGQRGLTHRDEIWKVIISRMEGNWIFGYGLSKPLEPIPILGGRHIVHNSHSVYLEIIYQVGLVGLFLYLLTLSTSVYTLFKAYLLNIYSDLSVLFLGLLVSISVVMLTELNSWIHTPNLLWMWLWVPIAVSLSFDRELKAKLVFEE